MLKWICLAGPNRVALTVFGVAAGISSTSFAALTPINLTGWTQDVIAENTATSPVAGTTTDYQSTTNKGDWVWYEKGAPNTTQGLPTSGSFTSAYNSAVTFQYQPYTADNAVLNTGTVTLTTPGKFDQLAFLHSAQGGNNNFTATLHFSDQSTTALTSSPNDPDWVSSGQNAISNIGLVHRNDTWTMDAYAGSLNMFEHDFALSPTDQAKTLVSIDWQTNARNEDLFAVSGESVPEPATLAVIGLSSLGLMLRRRRNA